MRVSIGRQIIATCIVIIAGFILMDMYMYHNFKSMERNYKRMINDSTLITSTVKDIRAELWLHNTHIRNYILTGDSTYQQASVESQQEINNRVKELEAAMTSPRSKKEMGVLKLALAEHEKVLSMGIGVRDKLGIEATSKFLSVSGQRAGSIEKIIDDFLVAVSGEMNGKIADIEAEQRRMTVTIIVLNGIVLALAMAIAVWLSRRIAHPLASMADAAIQIAKGNLGVQEINYDDNNEIGNKASNLIVDKGTDILQMAEIYAKDEIGRLAASFNIMTSQLKKTTVSKGYVDNIISSMTDSLIVIDPDNRIQTVNEATAALLQYDRNELMEQPIDLIFPSFEEMPFKGEWMKNLTELGEYKNYETTYKTKSGLHIPVLLSCSVMKTDEQSVQYIVCTAKDITDLKRAEEIMFYQANYDMLTGLANRYYFEKKLHQATLDVEGNEQRHTILYLDLDQFKIVNDTCGHYAGDQLLKHVSLIMKEQLQPEDLIARLGGDEFGVLLRNTDISGAYCIAVNLCNEIQSFRFTWQDKLFTIGVSIGAVELNQQDVDVGYLLSAADRACYMAKEKGGNRVHLFHNDDRELSERHGEMRWMPSITKAFEEDRFYLHYQPIVPVASNKNRDWYEVLIRMIDEHGDTVLPGAFLPAAERYNMMPAIDRWVIHHLFSTYKDNVRLKVYGSSVLFNINISGASLNNGAFLQFVCEEFDRYGVPPAAICFEITETSAVSNFTDANQFIQKLRSLGCSFALDDFGRGLSSFAYLKYLPVDFLKIDGSFIKNIASNQVDFAMVSSINEVAHLMGMKTVAEFVENKEIFACLKRIGIDYAQGYWIGKPAALDRSKDCI